MHRSIKHQWNSLAALALIAAAYIAAPSAAEAPEPAALVPKEAIAYFGITDIDTTWETFKKTSGYAVMQNPELREAVAEWAAAGKIVDKIKTKIATALDTQADQLKNPFKGPVALYLLGEPGSSDPSPVFIGTIGDKSLAATYFETATKKLKAAATDAEEKEAGSVKVLVFKNNRTDNANANGDGADAEEDLEIGGDDPMSKIAGFESAIDELFTPESMPSELAMCKTDEHLIVGANEAAVRTALRREAGSALSDSDEHKSMLRLLDPIGPVRMLVNIPRVIDFARPKEGVEDFEKALKASGFDSARSFILTANFAGDGYEGRTDAMLVTSSERTGALKLLNFENISVTPPANIDANNVFYACVNLNPPKFMDELERLIRQVDPAGADQFRQFEAVPLGEQPVNLRKELIDNLTGPVTFGLDLRKPFLAEEIRMLLGIGAKGRDSLQRLFGQIPLFTSREARGATIFDFAMQPMSLTITSDRLLIGSKPGIDTALAGETGAPVAELAAFKNAAKLVPKEAWFTFFSNDRKLTEALLGYAADENGMNNSMNPGAMMVGAMVESMIGTFKGDKEKAKQLLKYRGASLATVTNTPDGIRLSMVQIPPSAAE